MSARDDLHELVRTTALVLRRGTIVGLAAALVCAAISGGLLGIAYLAPHWAWPLAFVSCAVVISYTAPTILAAVVAAFAGSLVSTPRFAEVMKQALIGSPVVVVMAIFGSVPAGLVLFGAWLIVVAPFPWTIESPFIVVTGIVVLLAGLWTFGCYVLVSLIALFVDPNGVTRVRVVFVPAEIKGHEAVVFVTALTPLLGGIAVAGQGAIRAIELPAEVRPVVAAIAAGAIAIATLAVATGAYGVIDASRRDPSRQSEPAP